MNPYDSVKLADLVDMSDPPAVLSACAAIWMDLYPNSDFRPLERAFDLMLRLFAGYLPGYHACDTGYHNLRHTLDVFLASARLLDGFNLSQPPLPRSLAHSLLLAALFHDSGYIRRHGEESGSGARFTSEHVARSVAFIEDNADSLGLSTTDCVSRLIWATGLKAEFSGQDWPDEAERSAGAMLASADLCGQMADRTYLEKLLFLYYEFREAGFPGYNTEFDILRKTMDFYELSLDRLDRLFLGIRKAFNHHFHRRLGLNRDLYAEAMQRQIDYLKAILADDTSNFRHKLKRMDLAEA